MTSSVFLLRRVEWLCSPSTQRTASEMFDLPLPLGPMIAVMPGSKRKTVRLAKLLKPCSSSRVRRGGAEEDGIMRAAVGDRKVRRANASSQHHRKEKHGHPVSRRAYVPVRQVGMVPSRCRA